MIKRLSGILLLALVLVSFAAKLHRLVEQFAFQIALAFQPAQDAAMDHFVQPRHRRHDGRVYFGDIGHQLVQRFGVIDFGADRQGEELSGHMFV